MVIVIFLPSNYYTFSHPASLEVAKLIPSMGSSDWIPLSALLACIGFASAIKFSPSQSRSVLIFHFLPFPWETGIIKHTLGLHENFCFLESHMIASMRWWQKLSLCLTVPIPASSKMDPPLVKAEPIGNSGSTSQKVCLRSEEKVTDQH